MKPLAWRWLDEDGWLCPGVVVVALGGNLGGNSVLQSRCEAAADTLSLSWGPAQLSPFLVTAPQGEVRDQPEFVNGVAAFCPRETPSPEEALQKLLELEQQHGRTREILGGARTLDLDLLLVGRAQQSGSELTLPHPRMHSRAFVLEPLRALFGAAFRWREGGPSVGEMLRAPEVASQGMRPLL